VDYEGLWRDLYSLTTIYVESRVNAVNPASILEIMRLMEANARLEAENYALHSNPTGPKPD